MDEGLYKKVTNTRESDGIELQKVVDSSKAEGKNEQPADGKAL